ncbi:MAG: hypothetical protein Q8P56_02865 [Candidatus Uhrbacteria bacterium]|nr:hypothetical protein [Candidatus Uhrbacteria bacterium]
MKSRRQLLETLTCVALASAKKPRHGSSPLPVLSADGAKQTQALGAALKTFEAAPIDYVFFAVPHSERAAAIEMVIQLTGAIETGYSDLPDMGFPLTVREHEAVERIGASGYSSLGEAMCNHVDRDFLRSYAMERRGDILVATRRRQSRHGIIFGLPIFIQAIAWTFAKKREDRRRIENSAPYPGHALQIDVGSGTIRIPDEKRLLVAAQYK